MPVEINGQVYCRTLEVCKMTGISRATLLRWLKAGVIKKLSRDTRGWRLFTEEDLRKIRAKINEVDIKEES
jgi:predicted site-specific integrase-resolvase